MKAGFPDASLDHAGWLRIFKEQFAELAEPVRRVPLCFQISSALIMCSADH